MKGSLINPKIKKKIKLVHYLVWSQTKNLFWVFILFVSILHKTNNLKNLVTGGTGYVGSHIVVELLNNDFDVIILDNLSNSKIEVLDRIRRIVGLFVIILFN